MFDVGFWELTLIAVVALLVVGPERLPALARTTGLYLGKLRRFVAHVKDDVARELKADELKEMMEKSAKLDDVYDILDDTKKTVAETSKTLSSDALAPTAPDDKPATTASEPARTDGEKTEQT